uniref:DNA polymerase epsilon subunit 2 n=1 Tax=Gasterosteus aculeatus aculeatus TaxID=481459 RepID=A0AAQ4RE53_GASAC
MDVARKIKTKVSAGFKMRGLILRPDASRYLVEVLESVSASELDDVMEKVLDAVEKQPLSSSMIELSVVESAVQDCTQSCDETTAYYGNLNFFGGPSTTSVKASAKLKQLEEENEDAMFVIVSDVWLDNVEVMEKLNMMFSGYASMPPTCFILCGNFSSAPYGKTQIKSLKDSLKALADAICAHPSIHSGCRFVFVPGPEDPGPGNILPRPPLADYITEEFRQRVPFSVFTTNPCRIQYCSQEMVVIREDLVNKMCRNCVRLPNNNLDIPNHFVKTILSQGHLTPLPLYVSPVFWAYDYSLRVYPVPDVIIFADKYDPFSIKNTDCLCVNPGSFPKSGFTFKVYYPSNRTVEDSKLQGL